MVIQQRKEGLVRLSRVASGKSGDNIQFSQRHIQLLRFPFRGHPLLTAPMDYRSSYLTLLAHALRDMNSKYPVISQLVEGYAITLKLEHEEHWRLLQNEAENTDHLFNQALKTLKRPYFERVKWYKYFRHQFGPVLYVDVAYVRQKLEGIEDSKKFLEIYQRTLRLSPKKAKALNDFCNALMDENINNIEKRLLDCSPWPLASHLQFLSDRVLQNKLQEEKQPLYVGVVATMSAGKSTFLNALVGYSLFPSKNQACTAKIAELHHHDNLDHVIGYHATESTVDFSVNVNSDTLTVWNAAEDAKRIRIEGSLEAITNKTRKLVLFDTPGANYSQDKSHSEVTYRFLKEQALDVVFYIINATQIATDDDKLLLRRTLDTLKDVGTLPKIVFLLNQADELDPDGGESVESVTANVKKYIQEAGILDPLVIPISAQAAKLFRTALRNASMSKKESLEFRNLFKLFTEEDAQFLQVPENRAQNCDSTDDEQRVVGGREYHVKNIRLALHRTGITAVEALLNSML